MVSLTLHTREEKVEEGSVVVVAVVEILLMWFMMVRDRSMVIVLLSFLTCFSIIAISADKTDNRLLIRPRVADIQLNRFLTSRIA